MISPPDIAVTNVEPFKTAVGQGYSVLINVTVENQGIYSETFNVTLYADKNITVIGDEIIVGNQTVASLINGTSKTLAFTWNTIGIPYGNYIISATATPLPYEINTIDNNKTDGWVVVTILGDVSGDGYVNVVDLGLLSNAWLTESGETNHNPNADFNGDGYINVLDLGIMSDHWLQSSI